MERGRHQGEGLFIVAAVFALTGLGLTFGGLLTSLGIAFLGLAAAILVAGGVAQITAWIRPRSAPGRQGIASQTRATAQLAKATRLLGFLRQHSLGLALLGVAFVAVLAVTLGSFLPRAFASNHGETREFVIEASKFAYSPERLRVRQGDTVILRLQPQDVTHGLYLDGYGLETHAMPTEEGVLKFVADKSGKFRFRCSMTCGNLHPFMVGELNVESGTPYTNAPFLGAAAATIVVGGGTLAFVWRKKGD